MPQSAVNRKKTQHNQNNNILPTQKKLKREP